MRGPLVLGLLCIAPTALAIVKAMSNRPLRNSPLNVTCEAVS